MGEGVLTNSSGIEILSEWCLKRKKIFCGGYGCFLELHNRLNNQGQQTICIFCCFCPVKLLNSRDVQCISQGTLVFLVECLCMAPYNLAFAQGTYYGEYLVKDARGKIVEKKISKTKLTIKFYCLHPWPECILKHHL